MGIYLVVVDGFSRWGRLCDLGVADLTIWEREREREREYLTDRATVVTDTERDDVVPWLWVRETEGEDDTLRERPNTETKTT